MDEARRTLIDVQLRILFDQNTELRHADTLAGVALGLSVTAATFVFGLFSAEVSPWRNNLNFLGQSTVLIGFGLMGVGAVSRTRTVRAIETIVDGQQRLERLLRGEMDLVSRIPIIEINRARLAPTNSFHNGFYLPLIGLLVGAAGIVLLGFGFLAAKGV